MYMTKPPTQADRVYNALIERGSLIRDDFLGVTIDGHPPIQNLTAEIDRARKKYGIDVIPKKEGKITRWYFASPEAGYVTGQVLSVSGGLTMSG